MKNNFISSVIIFGLIILIGKEFLPFSYEIVVIFATISVFIYLKNTLEQVILEFFSATKSTIKEDFLTITHQASNNLNTDNITKFSIIEQDARNISITEAHFEFLLDLELSKHLDSLIISPINTVNGYYNDDTSLQ